MAVATDIDTKTKIKTKRPAQHVVILLNDDFTPMDFVMSVLVHYFSMNADDAYELMVNIHTNGQGIAGVFTKEIAEQKREDTVNAARKLGYPLQAITRPE